MTKTHVGRNAATYFTSSIPARASPIIGRTVQHNIPHPIPKVGVPVIAFGEKSCDKKAELHQLSRGPSGISDTSSTRSVSSSSSDATPDCMPNSTMVILPVPANGTWNLAADTHLFRPAAEDPRSSVIGNTIRQIMTLDVSNGSDGFHMPEPPPPPEGVFGPSDNPLSPRSLKNRPQIPVECPEEIRRRSRSDCLAHEVCNTK